MMTDTRPAVTTADQSIRAAIQALTGGNQQQISTAVAALGPVLRSVYDQGDQAWTAGAAADFLAATLYASPRYHLRVHAHAPGARDSDLHTHKGGVSSILLSGALTNTTARPVLRDGGKGLEVWRCTCRLDGSPIQQRTARVASVDPATVIDEQLGAGHGFTVAPGDYHRLSITPNTGTPTVTLCLFDRLNPDTPDAVVLTNRPTPVISDRDMTAAAARAALRRVLAGTHA